MNTRFAFLIIGLAIVAPRALGNPSPDEISIRAIVDQIVSGWNQGDGNGVAGVYAHNGTLVAGDGTVTHGRNRIASYHDRLFADFLKNTRLNVQVTNVKFLTRDIALMRTEGGILWPGETRFAPGNRGIQSFVVVRDNGTWRVLHFQNTRVREL